MSAKSRLLLDVGLLGVLIVAYVPSATGVSVHEWLSLAVMVPTLVHLVVNWDWVLRVVGRARSRLAATSFANLIVDAGLFLATVTVMVSGLAISTVVSRTLGTPTTATQLWDSVHLLSADATIALMLVHFALHWKWFLAAVPNLKEALR